MTPHRIPWIAALACAAGLAGQHAPAATQPAGPERTLDEVVVRAQRLHEIRQQMVAAEDRFYARYNALNQNDDFDIRCRRMRPSGSVMDKRRCYPAVVDTVAGEEAAAVLESIQYNTRTSGDATKDTEMDRSARPRSPPTALVLNSMAPAYERNMLKLLREHPELRQMVRERERLERRYDAERRKLGKKDAAEAETLMQAGAQAE